MTLIRKANQLNIQSKIKCLIYGQPGIGKTTFAISSPNPLLFDFDNGVHRVNYAHLENVDTVQIESYQNFLDVLDKENLSGYETLVIDTGGKALDYMADYIIKRNSKMGKANGSLTLQGYGERKAEFSSLVKRISLMNKHIIFVAHRETKTEGDETRFIPQFGGSNYDSLVTELDLVGYMEAHGRERTITFDSTSRNDGKNTCNLAEIIKIQNIVDSDGLPTCENNLFTRHIIEAYEKKQSVHKLAVIEYNTLMTEIESQILEIIDSDSINRFIERINEFKHIGSSKQVSAVMVSKKANELGLVLNKETKKYEPKV
jgi:phage nucleotide-binding protein